MLHSALVDPRETSELLNEGFARGLAVIVWLADGIFSPAHTPWVESYYSQTGEDPISFRAASELCAQAAEKIVWVGEPTCPE